MTTKALTALLGGYVSEIEISEPRWLYAGRITKLDTGESWRFAYRSSILRTDSQMHQSLMSWLDGAAPIGNVQPHDDSEMMYGTGELTLWEA